MCDFAVPIRDTIPVTYATRVAVMYVAVSLLKMQAMLTTTWRAFVRTTSSSVPACPRTHQLVVPHQRVTTSLIVALPCPNTK